MRTLFATPVRLGLLAMLLLSVFAWAPATFPGYWQGMAGFVPVFNASNTGAVASVAVAPDVWQGAGSATTLFTRPFIVLGLTPTAAVRTAFILAFLIGGCGIYAWLRRDLGDPAAGLAGLVYMLLPTFLATVYVHGSLADALLLAWLPLAFFGLAGYSRERSLAAAAFAVIAIVAMWRTQAGLAGLACVLLLAYALLAERRWQGAVVVVAAAATGFVTLLPDWALSAPVTTGFPAGFVDLGRLLDVRWPTGPVSPAGYPVQFGFVAIGFSAIVLGSLLSRRLGPAYVPAPLRRKLLFAFGALAVIVLLVLPVSAPLWQATQASRLLTYPWQLLILAAPLLALTAGALPVLQPALEAPAYWVALLTLVVLGSYAYLAPAYTEVQAPARPAAVLGANQLVVLDATLAEEGEKPRTATLDVTWQTLAPLAADDNVFFQAIVGSAGTAGTAGAAGGERVVAQLDVQPVENRPATGWLPGEIFTARYTLDISSAPAGEPLRYYFGFYDWQTQQRLPVDGGINDKLVFHGR